jgi:hypothetical protein
MLEYIKAEEFIKQSKEVKQVLFDWWKPSPYELVQGCYYGKDYDSERIWCIGDIDMDYCKNELKPIPLFTETLLRKFIEDKLQGKLQAIWSEWVNEYSYVIDVDIKGQHWWSRTNETDLLQAYWKVATEIASKESNLEMNRHS